MNLQFTSAAAKESMKKERRITTPGIHEDVKITNIENGTSTSGAEYTEFRFEKEDGAYTVNRVWFPRPESAQPNEGETQEQAAQREVNNKLQHLQHALETFLPSNQTVITAGSYKEFTETAIRRLLPAVKGENLRIKLLVDSKGQYVQFPRFTPYMEKQVDGQKSRLFITEWEQANRMTKAEPKTTGTSSIINNGNESTDELPF